MTALYTARSYDLKILTNFGSRFQGVGLLSMQSLEQELEERPIIEIARVARPARFCCTGMYECREAQGLRGSGPLPLREGMRVRGYAG